MRLSCIEHLERVVGGIARCIIGACRELATMETIALDATNTAAPTIASRPMVRAL